MESIGYQPYLDMSTYRGCTVTQVDPSANIMLVRQTPRFISIRHTEYNTICEPLGLTMKSCQQCRDAKRKCIPDKDSDSVPCCSRCLRHHLACSHSQIQQLLRTRLEARQPSKESDHQTKTIDDFLADDASVQLLVHEYLAKIHGRPHSIFHAATLWKDIRERRVSKALILAICAMGAHVAAQPNLRSLEPLLTAESKRLLQIDLERVCLENIQTCILVANLCVAHENPSSEFLFFRKLSSSIHAWMGL